MRYFQVGPPQCGRWPKRTKLKRLAPKQRSPDTKIGHRPPQCSWCLYSKAGSIYGLENLPEPIYLAISWFGSYIHATSCPISVLCLLHLHASVLINSIPMPTSSPNLCHCSCYSPQPLEPKHKSELNLNQRGLFLIVSYLQLAVLLKPCLS